MVLSGGSRRRTRRRNPFEFDTNIGTIYGKDWKPLFVHGITILKYRVLRENVADERHFVEQIL